ncbi:MAG TPA: hypothetical protein VG867_10495 [Rhizomicrobium sp.]|nr:hypothetical protein [Rhizomicrobium sp.]
MDSGKAQQLQQLLGSLPPQMASRLAKAIEIDRLNDGHMLPHEVILEGLRPVLRNQHAERAVTPLRLFCRPFEDLLTIIPRKTKQAGRIERSSITPVWNWVSQTLIPDAASEFSIGIKTSILAGNAEETLARAERFWESASKAMLSALASDRGRKAARAALGGDLVVADAREMALLLSIGKDVIDIQNKMPRHVPSLVNEQIWMLRDIYDRLIESMPEAAPYLAVIAMHRLERPWEALKLPANITRQAQDTLISSTDMGLVGEILLGDLEHYMTSIRAVRPVQFDADKLISDVVGFTTLSTGVVKAIEIRRDGKWGQRLLGDRSAVAEVMDSFMERAPKEVLLALPTVKSGSYAGGPRTPDLAHPADPEKSDRALAYVRLVGGCRAFAPAASFGASNKDAIDEISNELKAYTEGLLKELRSVTGEKRVHADQYFQLIVEMTALIFSREEADMLRRRGRAAAPTEAA